MLTAGDGRRVPVVTDRRVGWWLRFLAGFAVLYGTLAGLAEIDATGRLGLPILAVVLLVALVVERAPRRRPAGRRPAGSRVRAAGRAGRSCWHSPCPWPCWSSRGSSRG